MLHFAARDEWSAAEATGDYRPAAMASDGFIHLSFGHQLGRVATERVRGATDLVLLVVDPSGLEADLRIEQGFPHLYRAIPVPSVPLVVDLPPKADGSFEVPEPARLAELALTAQPSARAALARVNSVLNGFDAPWWLAGGWAVDAAAAVPSRPHLDLDVAVLRRDMGALGRHLATWDLRVAREGRLSSWDGRQLSAEDHQVWGRPDDGFRPERWQDFAADPGFVEFLAEDMDTEGRWVFRRDLSVRAPVSRLGPPGAFMAPEVALLYKAKAALGSDPTVTVKVRFDFDHALGHLDAEQRGWLLAALGRAHPGHPWSSALAV